MWTSYTPLLCVFLFALRVLSKEDDTHSFELNHLPVPEMVDKNDVHDMQPAKTVFISRLTFEGKDTWKDILGSDHKKLAQIAKDGFWQMTQTQFFKDKPKLRPTVMTVLPVGSDIYIASSMKGRGEFVYFAQDINNP